MVGKKVKEAMKLAKELEKIPEPTDKDIVNIYKEAKDSVNRLQKMLKPEWFVEDPADKKKKCVKKTAKKISKK